MMLSILLVAVVFASSTSLTLAQSVFAHVIVGNTYGFSSSDWSRDIDLAANAGIDGFALNVSRVGRVGSHGLC
jgi:glucan endo-1,3-alpha-glucosidase